MAAHRASHPGLNPHVPEIILNGWDPAAILEDVLLGNVSHANLPAIRVSDGCAKHLLTDENTEGVVEDCTMPHVGKVSLARVNEVVDSLIILRLAAIETSTSISM